MSRPEWIEVGRVSRPHGVGGEVRVTPSSDNPERFAPGSILHARPGRVGVAGPRLREQVRLTIESARGADDFPILAFREIADREAAVGLRGYVLEVRASQLPDLGEDEFYPFDLIGLEVRDPVGVRIGTVADVVESPAHAILVISEPAGRGCEAREIMVPFVRVAVPSVSVDEGYLVVAPGFLAKGDEPDESSGDQPGDRGGACRV